MELLLGIGGNLGDVATTFATLQARLEAMAWLRASSHIYRSGALGPPQPDYLNGALLIELELPATHFLEWCQREEATAGRERRHEPRWGPRPLDIDLLLAPDLVCRGPRLELPHPRLVERAFALVPAAELRPAWLHPLHGVSLAELAQRALARDPSSLRPL